MAFRGASSAMARRRALALLRCKPFQPPPPPLLPSHANFSTDFLSFDDLPPPQTPLPRPRSLLSSKRSSLSRRLAAREPPDELADFHGLQNSTFQETLDRLDRLDKIGIRPHPATYAALLQSAGNRDTLENGKLVHEHIIKTGFTKDIALCGLIVQMYRRCKSVEGARDWFDRLKERNLYIWNCMLGTYAQYGKGKEALELFDQMRKEEWDPDNTTFLALLAVISGEEQLGLAHRLHGHIYRSPYRADNEVGISLVSVYGRCGNLKNARKMFGLLYEKNVEAWNALSAAYAQNRHYKDVLDLFKRMLEHDEIPDERSISIALSACANEAALTEGKKIHTRILQAGLGNDKLISVNLVNFYGKCGDLQESRGVFDAITERDVMAWNTMIRAYTQHGHGKEALELFEKMKQDGLTPNRVTFICCLSACANQGALAEGKDIHSQVSSSGLETDLGVAAALIHMYGSCGSLEEARGLFDKVSERHVILWNAMIAAYAQNGHGEEALKLFDKLQEEGLIPDIFTYASILSVCSCSSPESAFARFEKIPERNVAAWNAMITAYGEHGHAKQALELFDQMQREGVTPDKATFVNILSACASAATLSKCSSQEALDEGKKVQAVISQRGFESDTMVGNALVNLFGRCGSVHDAKVAFDKIAKGDVLSWNHLITAHALNGQEEEAQRFFKQAQAEGIISDKISYASIGTSHTSQGHTFFGGAERYKRFIDLLGNVGKLDELEHSLYHIPFVPPNATYSQLTGISLY